MFHKIVIYAEKFKNLPSEKAEVFTVLSFFLSKGFKVQLERLDNVVHMSNDGNSPLFSIDSKLYSGIDKAKVIIDELIIKINDKGDQNIQAKPLSERIKFHEEITQFYYAKYLFANIFVYEEWQSINGFEITKSLYENRYCWPLNQILLRQKRNSIQKVLKYGHFMSNREDLLKEFETFCIYLNANLTGDHYLFDRLEISQMDLLINGYISVFFLHPAYFQAYLDIVNRHQQIGKLIQRISESHENVAEAFQQLFVDQ